MSGLPDLRFEPLSEGTLEVVARIAAEAPDPWSAEGLRGVLADENQWCLVALVGGVPVGFACVHRVLGSADLNLIAVTVTHRRQGVAEALLRRLLAEMPAKGAQRCLLEVRRNNPAAIALYEKLGFKTLALRPGMYQNPLDDGLLMERILPK